MELSTVKQFVNSLKQELKDYYPDEEIRNFAWIILDHLLGFSRVDMLMKEEQTLNNNEQAFCKDALNKLAQHVPIQHIIGYTEFYGLKYKVSKDVLIPRPETEELVQWIIEQNKVIAPKILDIGTGSGCIPISLKKNIPQAEVTGWDISQAALTIAKGNAVINNVEINFKLQNIFEAHMLPKKKYDIIVSNPPYIRALEKEFMHKNVLNNEPHLALFVEDSDPLLFYRAISKLAIGALNTEGSLYFEINEALGKETCDLMLETGFKHVELRKDLFGKDRMVKGCLM